MIWIMLLAMVVVGIFSIYACHALNYGLEKWKRSGRSEITYIMLVAAVTFTAFWIFLKSLTAR